MTNIINYTLFLRDIWHTKTILFTFASKVVWSDLQFATMYQYFQSMIIDADTKFYNMYIIYPSVARMHMYVNYKLISSISSHMKFLSDRYDCIIMYTLLSQSLDILSWT